MQQLIGYKLIPTFHYLSKSMTNNNSRHFDLFLYTNIRSWASRRRRSALTLSWSGNDSGYPAADAIFVAQSQREEREAWGCLRVEAAEANLTWEGAWSWGYGYLNVRVKSVGVCRVGFLNFCFYSIISFSLIRYLLSLIIIN